jgi:hypothetical protein
MSTPKGKTMNAETKPRERFNPEPWLRSVLWIALAAALVVTVYRGNPFEISGGGVKVVVGGPTIPGATAPGPKEGEKARQRDSAGTTFVSICPPKTRAIGGSCTIRSGNGALQNFGPELNTDGNWQFVCVWGGSVDGDALATCLPASN